MIEHATKDRRRKVARKLRRAIREGRVTREAVMEAAFRGPRIVEYWLSGEVLPPARVLAVIEGLCK